MANKSETNQKGDFASACGSVISGTITVFLAALVLLFPLVFDDGYFNILETKYHAYYGIILVMLGVIVFLGLAMMLIDRKEFQGYYTKEFFGKLSFKSLKEKNWKEELHIADMAVLVFWLICAISTIQSDYVYEAFWGNEGRYTGLFLTTVYVVSYFVISRHWKARKWIFEAFLVSGMFMCLFGISDYFQLDLLGLRNGMRKEQYNMFVSTIGNINTYTAYVAIVMGFATAMFAGATEKRHMIWYYSCMIITFFAIIMGSSDNAYLALGALFVFLPFVLFQTRTGIFRYLIIAASFCSVIHLVDLINLVFGDVVIGLEGLFRVIVEFKLLWGVTILLWLVVAILYQKQKKLKKLENVGTLPVKIWTGLILAAVLVGCFMLYDANVAGNAARYGGLGYYLEFNDHWGTNRGYIWRKSFELYADFPILHKLFGYGPDTFGILTQKTIYSDMVAVTNQIFDSAHNEYIQFFVTVGPIGTVAYIAFFVAAIVAFVKNRDKNPYLIGCAVAALCYAAQAFVNLNLPVVTPMFWFMLSVGMSIYRGTRGSVDEH